MVGGLVWTVFLFSLVLGQMIAPLVPEEFVANVIQKKWNENGFLVSFSLDFHQVMNVGEQHVFGHVVQQRQEPGHPL